MIFSTNKAEMSSFYTL